jgi:hypothetical protein
MPCESCPICGHRQETRHGFLICRKCQIQDPLEDTETNKQAFIWTIRKAVILVDVATNLTQLIDSLTPEEQESVREFVEFLKRRTGAPSSAFLAAVDEFITEHPELLRRLAQ